MCMACRGWLGSVSASLIIEINTLLRPSCHCLFSAIAYRLAVEH